MKTADDYLDEDIREEFGKHHSAFRTARALGISLDRVKLVVAQEDYRVQKKASQYDGWGRPELRQYVVARKDALEQWDNTRPELSKLRAQYEAGTHMMVQGRDGDWVIQYGIPRAVVDPQPRYFQLGSE